MRTLAELICCFSLILIQLWWTKYLAISGLSPDFVFSGLLALGAFFSRSRSAIWAFLLGLYADMLSNCPIGTKALVYTLSAWLMQSLAQRFDLLDKLTQSIIVFLLTILAYLLNWLILIIFTNEAAFSLKQFCFLPFLNMAAALLLFPAALEFKRRFFYDKA